MKVLVACEFSGIVRDAFIVRGHDAVSCDLLPTEKTGPHIVGDVRREADLPYDMMIAFPPCTHLCSSGARWWAEKTIEQQEALEFIMELATSPIPYIAIENPIGALSRLWRAPDQIIQPWQFGEVETKATCLWLKNLPPLTATHADDDLFLPAAPIERLARVHREPPGPDRWKNRSRTYQAIADAMSEQWGGRMTARPGERR